MKQLKKLSALCLALVLLVSLAACGESAEKKIAGSYQMEMDCTSLITSEMSDEDLEGMDLTNVSFIATLTLTLNEDKSYTLGVENDPTKASLDDCVSTLSSALQEYLYQSMESMGVDRDTADATFQEQYGQDIPTFVESAMSEIDTAELMDEITAETDSGTFSVKDGKIYFDSKDCYVAYTQDGDNLTVTEYAGNALELSDMEDEIGSVLPLTLTKQ